MSEPARSGTQMIRQRGSPAEAGIHMNDLRAAFLGVDYPLKTYGMILRHVRAHDQNRIGIEQVLGGRRCSASSIRCAQTGHSGAVSNTGLVADANHAQTSGE